MSAYEILDEYNRGLAHIRREVENAMQAAGARLAVGSVMHPKWPAPGDPPVRLTIRVVPYDSPGMEFEVTHNEILDCDGGVRSTGVKIKLEALVERYRAYRAKAGYTPLGDRTSRNRWA